MFDARHIPDGVSRAGSLQADFPCHGAKGKVFHAEIPGGPSLASICSSELYVPIVFDTETSGTQPQRLIKLAAYAPSSGQGFHCLVKCPDGLEVGGTIECSTISVLLRGTCKGSRYAQIFRP